MLDYSVKSNRLAEVMRDAKQGGAEALTRVRHRLPALPQQSPISAGMGAPFPFSCVVYSNLIINKHLSLLKCCGCPKINVFYQGGRLDQRQWKKR